MCVCVVQAYSLKCTELYYILSKSKNWRLVYKSNEVKIKFRLVRRLDETIPFHREIL